MIENSVQDRKWGNWKFILYQPDGAKLPIVTGRLQITKDFYWIEDKNGQCLLNVPSQNVAYVRNEVEA